MSKLRDHLTESSNNSSENLTRELEGMFEDIFFQLDTVAEMKAINFNLSRKLRKTVADLRRVSEEIYKDVRGK